jgi:predicted PurR-regulated permease PerM
MGRGSDPPGRPPRIQFDRAADAQRVARLVLAAALGLLGLWILRPFIAALAWAVIIAIAAWPLFERLNRALGAAQRGVLAPLAMTLLIGLIFILPFALVARELVRDMGGILVHLAALRRNGVSVPDWLPQLPGFGRMFAQWWQANLADPDAMQDLLGRAYGRIPTETVREFGGEIVHRLALFGFTLLTSFFLFRDGADLGGQLVGLSDRLLGPGGERVGRHMIAAVHGTLNGLVLVGLAEGMALGGAYWLAGLPHPVSVGALTGVLAAIPFAAPVVFGAAALYLFAVGSRLAAGAVLVFGFVVVFIADHAVRPFVIGGAARLPFLWVLLGILGGLESFGFLGLFLGPVTMAALMSLWRDWTQSLPPAGRPVPAAPPPPP